jgi:hypothetical protein
MIGSRKGFVAKIVLLHMPIFCKTTRALVCNQAIMDITDCLPTTDIKQLKQMWRERIWNPEQLIRKAIKMKLEIEKKG